MKRAFFALIPLLISWNVFAQGNPGLTYQGRLLKPDGKPVTASSVQFRLQIRTGDPSYCVMYEETQVKDLSQSSGVFAITLNDGSASQPNAEPYTLTEAFRNVGSITFPAGKCTGTNVATFLPTSSRQLTVSFNDGSFSGWEPLPAQKINFVPMAFDAMHFQGRTPGNFFRVETIGAPENMGAWSVANYTKLTDLVANTTISGGNASIGGNAAGFTGSLAGDVTGGQSLTKVEKIQGNSVLAGVPSDKQVLTWNHAQLRWEPANVPVAGNPAWGDITGKPTEFAPGGNATGDLTGTYPNPTIANNAVDTLKILDGTISGLDLDFGGAISTTSSFVLKDSLTHKFTEFACTTLGHVPTWTTTGFVCQAPSMDLMHFTESLETAAPNATVPVVSFKPNNAAVNVDMVLSPKGNGALAAQVADGTVGGGNKRGKGAVDWQMERYHPAEVASGSYSAIVGGHQNTASGWASSVLGGYDNRATSESSATLGGGSNIANSMASVVVGGQVNTANEYAAAILGGEDNDASGIASVVLGGRYNKTSGIYSVATGYKITSDSYAQVTMGRFNLPIGSEDTQNWQAADPLFVVGNGASDAARSNALMILKNGNMGLGTNTPGDKLHVAGKIRAAEICDEAGANCKIISSGWGSGASSLSGDVSGAFGTTTVDAIKGKSVVPVAYSTGQHLRYDGTNWVNALVDLSTDMTGTLPIARGGTGAVSQSGAINNLLPSQTGNINKILQTDGTNVSWVDTPTTGITALTGDVTASGTGSVTATIANNAVTTAKIADGTITGLDLDFGATNSAASVFVLKDSLTNKFTNFACSTTGHVPTWTATGFVCQAPSITETDPKVGANTTNMLSKWNGTALVASGVYENGGSVGIGLTSPAAKLDVLTTTYGTASIQGKSDAGGGVGVYGISTITSGGVPSYGVRGDVSSDYVSSAGVFGRSTSTSGSTFGVRGENASPDGNGVYGIATSYASSTNYGVAGHTHGTGYGVYGSSTNGGGVFGKATTSNYGTTAVLGQMSTGFANAMTYGVRGISDTSVGYGVYGDATHTTGTNYGVYGRTASPDGYGVYSENAFGAAQAIQFLGDLTPAQITSNVSDYNPANLKKASVLRLSSDASRDMTSLAGGLDGRILTIMNVGNNPIVLKNDDGLTGTAANRFALTGDLTLVAKQSAILMYDSTASRWRQIANVTASSGDFMKDGSVAMTGNLEIGDNYISHDGTAKGIRVTSGGDVLFGSPSLNTYANKPTLNVSKSGAPAYIMVENQGVDTMMVGLDDNRFASIAAENTLSGLKFKVGGSWTSTPYIYDGESTDAMTILSSGNVGIGTAAPNALLDVAGQIRATHICASNGTNCKDLLTSWGSGGSVTNVTAGTGLTGGSITTSGTIGLGTELAGLNALSTTGFMKRTAAGAYSTATTLDLATETTGTLAIARGGTGATTQQAAINNLLPSQTGNTNKILQTDGTNVSWVNTPTTGITALTGDVTASGTGSVTATIANNAVTTAKIADGTITGLDLDFGATNSAASVFVLKDSLTNKFTNFACSTTGHVPTWTATGFVCQAPSITETDPKVGANTTNMLSKWSGTALVASGIYEDGSGNVGIGTTTPNGLLHVSSGGNNRLHIGAGQTSLRGATVEVGRSVATAYAPSSVSSSDPGGAELRSVNFNSAASSFATLSLHTNDGNARAYIAAINPASGNTPTIAIGQQTGANSYQERMRIDAAGNVGIGTTDPSKNLEVSAADASTEIRVINSSSSSQRAPGVSVRNYAGSTSGYPSFSLLNSRGNSSTTAALNANDRVGSLMFSGMYNASGGYSTVAQIDAEAEGSGAYAVNDTPGRLIFKTTADGSGSSTERMRINSSGNVGIGTTNPGARLEVATAGSASNETGFMLKNPSTAAYSTVNFDFYTAGTWKGSFWTMRNNTGSGGVFGISTANSSGSGVERLRIDDNGNMGLGDSPAANYRMNIVGDGTPVRINSTNSTATKMTFSDNGTDRGYIGSSATMAFYAGGAGGASMILDPAGNLSISGTTYTPSDRRYKEKIETVSDSLDKLLSLNGVTYNWKASTGKSPDRQMGVIAQDVEQVFPEAVRTEQSGYKSVNYVALFAPVIEAIKEIFHRVVGLEEQQAEQSRELASLKSESETKDRRIEALEKENSAIKAYLCEKDPAAALCH